MSASSSFLRPIAYAVAATTLLLAPSAQATPESEAKDLFARARELRAHEDCGSASPLFRKAWGIYPQGLGSLRNLAECEEILGRFASSRRSWLDLKRALITAAPNPKYDGWDNDAETAANRLKPKVASFVVDVFVSGSEGEILANEKTGVVLFVNGESVGTQMVGTPVERDPGRYLIRAQYAGATPVEQVVALSAGDNPKVTIRLKVAPDAAPPPKEVVEETSSPRRTAAFVVGGIGAAALIAGGIAVLFRSSEESQLDDQCPSHNNCPSGLQDTVDSGKTMSTLATILFPVGVVGLGAGAFLFFTSSSPRNEPAKAARAIRIRPSLGGAVVSGRF